VNESNRDINNFFKLPKEQHIKDFFLKDVDALLEKYDAGLQKHKPDVVKQIGEIEKERAEQMQKQMQQQQQQQQQPVITIQSPGQPPQQLTMEQVVQMIQGQQCQIEYLMRQSAFLESNTTKYQKKIMDAMLQHFVPKPAPPIEIDPCPPIDEGFTRIEIMI
jgi:hypothetical protein